MIDKGVGGGIMVCIIDVLREGGSGVVLNVCWEGGCMYYPHSSPNNLVINRTGMVYTIYIRYKPPPPPIYYTYIYKVWISFSGRGSITFCYTIYIRYEIQLSWNVIQILICSTWNVVKISLTHPHQYNSRISLQGWGNTKRKGKNFYPHQTKGNRVEGVGEVSDYMNE
mgnify:CR=1 FL=1